MDMPYFISSVLTTHNKIYIFEIKKSLFMAFKQRKMVTSVNMLEYKISSLEILCLSSVFWGQRSAWFLFQ